MKKSALLSFCPLIATTIANVIFIGYFFISYGGLRNFFTVNRSVDINLLVNFCLLFTGVFTSLLSSIVVIIWLWRSYKTVTQIAD